MPTARLAIAAALSLGAAAAASPPASAQQPICGDRASLVTQLQKKYGEARRAMGLQGESTLIEVFASSDTGTWTILFTRPDGVTCAVAAGQAWREEDGEAATESPI
ncbi:MAG: hypothetical protein ACFCUS_15140 [Rubrimonas sp.]|uniref:hypothetical protein n=1 Tax=Rubrimonas sp. TaxID=2036015 RepID=UPI002FDDED90